MLYLCYILNDFQLFELCSKQFCGPWTRISCHSMSVKTLIVLQVTRWYSFMDRTLLWLLYVYCYLMHWLCSDFCFREFCCELLCFQGVPSHMYGTYRQLSIGRRSLSPEVSKYERPASPQVFTHHVGKSSSNDLRMHLEQYWLTGP